MSRSDVVAALAAERVADLRRQIDYLASTVALLPASPRRAAARADVLAIERDIAELLRHLGVDDPTIPHHPPVGLRSDPELSQTAVGHLDAAGLD